MFPCPKSERIDQAKQLLLCYSSGESQAVYLAAGLWGEVVIILSRNIHWKAKSLYISRRNIPPLGVIIAACKGKQRVSAAAEKLDVCCSLWAVGSRCSLCGVHPSVCSSGLHSSGKTSSRLYLSSTWASALWLAGDYWIKILFIKHAYDLDLPLVPVVSKLIITQLS